MSGTDAIAFGIVGLAAGYVVRSAIRDFVVTPASSWLLRHGHVKLAMRVRKGVRLLS